MSMPLRQPRPGYPYPRNSGTGDVSSWEIRAPVSPLFYIFSLPHARPSVRVRLTYAIHAFSDVFACTLAGLRYEIGSSVGRRDERNTSFVDREVTRSWKKKKRFVAGGEAASMQIARDLWGLFSSRVPWSGEKEFRSLG